MKIIQFRKDIDRTVEEGIKLAQKTGTDVEVRDGKRVLMTIKKDATLEEVKVAPLRTSLKDVIIQAGLGSQKQLQVLTGFFQAHDLTVKD